MATKKRHPPEPIIHRLRQAEVGLAAGQAVPQVCRKLGVSEQTYHRWRKEYGGVRTDQAERLEDLGRGNQRLRTLVAQAELGEAIPPGGGPGKLLSPGKRRAAVEHVRDVLGRDRASERRACQALGPPRSTQRREPPAPDDEPALVRRVVELPARYGRYGYRRVAAVLRAEGFAVNHERVERLWRRDGLKAAERQPARRRLWLNDGSCVRRRPAYANGYVESFDGKLRDGLLNAERFDAVLEARALVERWRRDYNAVRPHSSLGYRPPAPEARLTDPPRDRPSGSTEADHEHPSWHHPRGQVRRCWRVSLGSSTNSCHTAT